MADPVLHGGAFIDGRDKVCGLKIKKLAAAAFEKPHHCEVFASKPQFQTPESLVNPKLYSSESLRQVKNEEIVTAP